VSEALARRVQRLEDLEAIRALKARYLNACDQQDPERAASCFASGEIVIDMGHLGRLTTREQFATVFSQLGCQPFVLDLHHGGNPELAFIDDDHVTGVWSLDYRNLNTQAKTVTFLAVTYHDEYRRLDGEWRITGSRSQFRTALHCSYANGTLEALLADRSVAALFSAAAPANPEPETHSGAQP
jgi:hypothetical protein